MGKISDQQLAELISRRILEIIDLTGLTIESLAGFVGVSVSTVRSIYRKTASISVDSLSKICVPFAIELADFFHPTSSLKIDEAQLPHLTDFKKHFFGNQELRSPTFPIDDKISQSEYHRQQRELIAYIVYRSDYFDTPKTIESMVTDFSNDYQTKFTPERLYALLLKYLGRGILEKKILPRTSRRMPASKRPYLYFKKESVTA
ncbi:MAG: helix-turn-helix domain-containing protein [Sphingobacterium sp.]|jgi:transcriptional regulator with XRE-family HTH domain|uniref:helix-turn-helix domain-containing protein n=1 Tax=Sphingobacterium sp. TaxID=341027 RepID=UPI002831FD84|nr:helix-turn-helix transcriptional regulator [Sphingobacterium sp.]MDR0261976.1 helix-turn-helix domain-containing protein [Sphingobacterium sp.]